MGYFSKTSSYSDHSFWHLINQRLWKLTIEILTFRFTVLYLQKQYPKIYMAPAAAPQKQTPPREASNLPASECYSILPTKLQRTTSILRLNDLSNLGSISKFSFFLKSSSTGELMKAPKKTCNLHAQKKLV